MKATLVPGLGFEIEFTVTPPMCPRFDEEPVHPVCATWTVVHYMELAGRRVLEPHLDPHEEGMGVQIRVDHRSPAVVGSVVHVCATATAVAAGRLTCAVRAAIGGRTVAEGEFVQAILPRDVIARLIERHRPATPGSSS